MGTVSINILTTTNTATAEFGGLTLAGAGGLQLTIGGANLTNASVLSVGSASGCSISAGGVISPTSNGSLASQNGLTVAVGSDQGYISVTLSIVSNSRSVKDLTELSAANAAASSGEGTLLRPGNYNLTTAWNSVPANGTITSHDNSNRAVILCGGVSSYNAWSIPDGVTVTQVNFLGDFDRAVHGGIQAMVSFNKTVSGVVIDDCIFDGGPLSTAVGDGSWFGLIGGDGSMGIGTNGLTIQNCTFTRGSRGLQIRGGVGTGVVKILYNEFYNILVDGIFLTETLNNFQVVGNLMYDFTNVADNETLVLAVDTATDRIQIADTTGWDAASTLNFTSSTGTLPTGTSYTTDYAYTVIDVDSAPGWIELDTFDLTDAGSSVYVRTEPPHGDFIQMLPIDGTEEMSGGVILLNRLYATSSTGTRDDPDYQGIFANTLTATQTVSAVDTANDRLTVSSTADFDVPNKFLQFSGTALPTGVSAGTDYAYTVFDSTTLQMVGLDLVDSGTSLTVRCMDGRVEDIVIGGNRVISNAFSGINLAAADNCIIAGNEALYLSGYAVPRVIGVGTDSRFTIPGENNIVADNIGVKILETDPPVDAIKINNFQSKIDESITWGGDGYYSAIFDGPTFDPNTVAEAATVFAPKAGSAITTGAIAIGLGSYADFDNNTLDHPRLNTPTTSGTLTDEVSASTSTVYTAGPIQVTAIKKAWPTTSDASNEVAAYATGGTSPEIRITSDAGGSSVVTDWTTSQNVLAAVNEYVWIRDTSSGSASTTTTARLRVGQFYDDWSITTA